MVLNMIITIDGPSGTGKSTLARELAGKLGFSYFDTGAMYRAITWFLMQQEEGSSLKESLDAFSFRVQVQGDQKHYYINDEDRTNELRSREVTDKVSEISALKDVRDAMVSLQQGYGKQGSDVFEGRDMGTVVFPNASVKIFLTACIEVRARRRFIELSESGKASELTYQEVLKSMDDRDEKDTSRDIAPLCQADDAVVIDTSEKGIPEILDMILSLISKEDVT